MVFLGCNCKHVVLQLQLHCEAYLGFKSTSSGCYSHLTVCFFTCLLPAVAFCAFSDLNMLTFIDIHNTVAGFFYKTEKEKQKSKQEERLDEIKKKVQRGKMRGTNKQLLQRSRGETNEINRN